MKLKIIIENKQFNQSDNNIWLKKRLKKAYRTLHLKFTKDKTIQELQQELTHYKEQLSDDKIRKILQTKLNLSKLIMKIAVILSKNKRRIAHTTIFADGISAQRFSECLDYLMMVPTNNNRKVNLSVNPEHYVLTPDENGVLEVIETTGNSPIPTQFFISFNDESKLSEPRDYTYSHQSVGVAKLKDGTIIGGVRHQFKNTTSGIECKLAVEFPSLCPRMIVRAHQKHLAIEFSNWLIWTIENQNNLPK